MLLCVCAGGGSWKRWPSTRCWWSTRMWWSSTGPGRRIAYSTFKWSCVNSGRYIISFLDDSRMPYIQIELWELKPKLPSWGVGEGVSRISPHPLQKVSSLLQKFVFSRTLPMPSCSLTKCLCFSLSQCVIQWQSVYVSISTRVSVSDKVFMCQCQPVCHSVAVFLSLNQCLCFSLRQCFIQWQSVYASVSASVSFSDKVFICQSQPVCHLVTKCLYFSLSQCVIQ